MASQGAIRHAGRVAEKVNPGEPSRFRRDPLTREDILRSLTEAKLLISGVVVDQNFAEMDDAHTVPRDQREVLHRISNLLTDLVTAVEQDG